MKTIIAIIVAFVTFSADLPAQAATFCGPVCVRKVPTGGGGYRCARWKTICGRAYP